jgi:hypothetical protein
MHCQKNIRMFLSRSITQRHYGKVNESQIAFQLNGVIRKENKKHYIGLINLMKFLPCPFFKSFIRK